MTTSRTGGKSYALLTVVEDGASLTGLGFYSTTLSVGLPTFDLEKYTEVSLKVTAEPDKQDRLHKVFYPVKRQSAAAPAVRAAGVAA